jgi:hypothetical protein
MRKPDWVEQPELLAELRRALASGPGPLCESPGEVPELDPEATDALVRLLAPRPRLSAGALSEWYADRALQLDAETGQLQVRAGADGARAQMRERARGLVQNWCTLVEGREHVMHACCG